MDLKVQIQSGTSTWHESAPVDAHKPAPGESTSSHPEDAHQDDGDKFESGAPAGAPRQSNVEFNF